MQLGKKSGSHEKQHGGSRGRTGLKWAQAGRSAQPIPGPVRAPFDLDDLRAIYSPRAKYHSSSHSSFAAEEQRS